MNILSHHSVETPIRAVVRLGGRSGAKGIDVDG